MATELSKAYVQIIPSAEGISGKIKNLISPEAASAGDSAGASLGGSLVGAFKKVLVGAGIGTAFKQALSEGGDLQQSFGGIDTLYGEAADAAKAYAAEAAKAGISANDFAEQAVSFGASLKKAFEGDTTKAVESANTAIMDMADNAAKMGTPVESIQAAYQSFARGQYVLLDNLKLGYGGTKTEMERLLADAEKISGVHYNLDNLGDVYEAIHVIQGELGLTGVAAEEASTTLSGSAGAMKAAFTNVLANLSLGNDIKPALNTLFTTTFQFLNNNLLPMIGNVLQGLPDVLGGLTGIVDSLLNSIANNSDQYIDAGVNLVSNLANAIITAVPYMLEAAYNLASSLVESLVNYDWATAANNFITTLKDNMNLMAGEIFGQDAFIVNDILASITASLPTLLQGAQSIVTSLVSGIQQAYPMIMQAAVNTINSFAMFVLQNAPSILQTGVNILMTLINGIATALPQLALAVIEIVGSIGTYLIDHYQEIVDLGISLVTQLVNGLVDAVALIIEAMPEIISAIVDTLLEVDWLKLGGDIVTGIVKGIKAMASTLIKAIQDLAKSAFDAVKDFFQIGSPSRLMENEVGHWIPPGAAIGIEENERPLLQTMEDMGASSIKAYESGLDYSSIQAPQYDGTSDIAVIAALLAKYLPGCAEKVVLDGESLLNGINRGLGMEGMAVL